MLSQRHHQVWQQLSRTGSMLKGLYYVQRDNKLVNFAHLPIPGSFDASQRNWYQAAIKTPGINVWSAPTSTPFSTSPSSPCHGRY